MSLGSTRQVDAPDNAVSAIRKDEPDNVNVSAFSSSEIEGRERLKRLKCPKPAKWVHIYYHYGFRALGLGLLGFRV